MRACASVLVDVPLSDALSCLRCRALADPAPIWAGQSEAARVQTGRPGWCAPRDMPKLTRALDAADVSRVIEMAWEDRTPFEAIKTQFGLDEAAVTALMRQQLKPGSFRRWRDRVHGRKTKHAAMQPIALERDYRHQARHRTPQR